MAETAADETVRAESDADDGDDTSEMGLTGDSGASAAGCFALSADS